MQKKKSFNGFKKSWKTFYILLSLPLLLMHQNCGQHLNSEIINSAAVTTTATPEIVDNPNSSPQLPISSIDTSGFEKISDTAGACFINQSGQLYCYDENLTTNSEVSDVTEQQAPKLHLSDKSFISVSTGFINNVCAITNNNKLYCKSLIKSTGQTTDGTKTDSSVFVAVDPSEDYLKVSISNAIACGITTQNKLKCWGRDLRSEVSGILLTPTLFDNSDSYSEVAVGLAHICAINLKNEIKCLGSNSFGQIGTSSSNLNFGRTFTRFVNDQFKKIAVGGYHTCGINLNDQLKCWGYNSEGQVGSGSTALNSAPVVVDSDTFYKSIFAGLFNTCGVTSTDTLKCWGNNSYSQISFLDQVRKEIRSPKILETTEKIIKVSLYNSTTCFLTENNFVKCIGQRKAFLFKKAFDNNKPVVVDAAEKYIQVVAANSYGRTCGITTSGVLKCWGSNYKGAADYKSGSVQIPVVIDSQNKFKSVQIYNSITCAITTADVLKCWGDNSSGLVGTGDLLPAAEPKTIDQGTTYKSISMNYQRNCGLTTAGVLKCWGKNINFSSVAAEEKDSLVPQIIDSNNVYKKVSTSALAVCGITNAGILKCWGNNVHAQLGVGDTFSSSSTIPVEVDKGVLYSDISLGNRYTCGITISGALKCWGLNDGTGLNILGLSIRNSDNQPSLFPVIIDSGVSYKKIFAGIDYKNGCAITTSGLLKCWGDNNYGQLGTGNNLGYALPTAVAAEKTFDSVNVDSSSHGCGIDTQSKLFCWGRNDIGQLGNNESFLNQYVYIKKVN